MPLIQEKAKISIHSLRVEGDCLISHLPADTQIFQSTPSVWRETRSISAASRWCGISIHSLRVEGDDD